MCRGAPKLCSRAIPEDASRANLEEIVDQHCLTGSDLWLANCYFAVDSLGFPVLLPFRVAPSHRSFHSSVPCPACSHLAASVP